MNFYAPSEAAERTGFSIDTLRYYERIGLIPEVGRTAGGQRRFTDADLAWLGMLHCLRDTGMPIAEMLRFAELTHGGTETIGERICVLEGHDARIEEQITRLRACREHVRGKIHYYRNVRKSDVWSPDREQDETLAGERRPAEIG